MSPVMDYKGKHWMQKPENREKMLAVIKKMQQTRRKSKAEFVVKRAVKQRKPKQTETETTSIILNGWMVTLTKGAIKIEKS